jgi:hypothetical protein
MPDDVEQLQRKIEECLREIKRLKAEEQRKPRPRLRLLKGGGLIAVGWSGVEWLLGTRKVALAFTAVTLATGGVLADHPTIPGADPPVQESIVAPPKPKTQPPEPRVSKTPKVTPGSQRTSPPRTQAPMRITPPPEPATRPAVKPKEKPKVTPTPSRTPPPSTPVVSLPVTPTILPSAVEAAPPCTINLLGIKVCLPLDGS